MCKTTYHHSRFFQGTQELMAKLPKVQKWFRKASFCLLPCFEAKQSKVCPLLATEKRAKTKTSARPGLPLSQIKTLYTELLQLGGRAWEQQAVSSLSLWTLFIKMSTRYSRYVLYIYYVQILSVYIHKHFFANCELATICWNRALGIKGRREICSFDFLHSFAGISRVRVFIKSSPHQYFVTCNMMNGNSS